jgi:hypothetical protein
VVHLGRRFLGAGGALALPAGFLAWFLFQAPDLGTGGWDLLTLLRRLEDNRRAWEDLDERLAAAVRRTEAKRQVAEDVAEGRVTLTEAAARVRDLNRASPELRWGTYRRAYPAASDEERFCREVISLVCGLAENDPERYLAVTERLEAELREYLDRGPLILPEETAVLRLTMR